MSSLIFLNKSEYLVPQLVAFLTKEWGDGLLDLTSTLMVVPTQESRRRLHEALVRKADSRGMALLPPRWMLPMNLTERASAKFVPASLEVLTWIQVIVEMTPEERLGLFPRKAPELDIARADELAATIKTLRGELSQAGMSLQDVEKKQQGGFAALRWKALRSLESRYLERISQTIFADLIDSQLEGSRNPQLPTGINRLVIAGVPDLPAVYDKMLPKLETQGIQIDVLVYDPVNKGTAFFDRLGRPNDAWSKTPIPIDQSFIHLCLDSTEESEKSALLAKASGGGGNTASIGVTATELAKPIKDALEYLDIPAFNPAGKSLDILPLGSLFEAVVHQLQENDFRSVLHLLRHPHIQRWLSLVPAKDLARLDGFQNRLIPSSLEDLLNRWPQNQSRDSNSTGDLKSSLHRLQSLLSDLENGYGMAPLLAALREIFTSVDLAVIPGGKETSERIGDWVSGSEGMLHSIPTPQLLVLLLAHLSSGICMEEKKSNAVELPGWLELLWEDAPHLIVAGMNDGLVPEVRQSDPFLHEALRKEWKLASDASRLQRDSYWLLSLMAARRDKGRVDLLLARQDEEGALLRPSRLLLRCESKEQLPQRTLELFRELPPHPGKKWHSAWALLPTQKRHLSSLSASLIKDYLNCPTRFYFKHLLNLKKSSFGIEEADAQTFGILMHQTLREFGTDPKFNTLHDAEQIHETLIILWRKIFDDRYGNDPSFPLLYQREAGIRRLRGAAITQAKTRSEGWKIVACERSFKGFPLHGMTLRGQIDRIDRRVTSTGIEWRIIDYKFSETEKNPAKEHYSALGKKSDPPHLSRYEQFEIDKKSYRWLDLQLPIYRMVLLSEIEKGHSDFLDLGELIEPSMDARVETGYFSVSAKSSDPEFIAFETLEQHQASAQRCLEGVADSVQREIFWPPRQPKYDEFAGLFFEHLEAEPSSGQQTLNTDLFKEGVL